MTSRELVKRTLEFESPERIPRDMWLLPWAIQNYPERVYALQNEFPDDIIESPPLYKSVSQSMINAYTPKGAAYTPGSFIDGWGCIFEIRQRGLWGEVKEPLLKDWNDINKVKIPENFLSVNISEINAFCKNTDKYVLGPSLPEDLPRPFERLQFIRGSNNLFIDLIDQPEEFFILLNKVHQFYIKVLETWAHTDVDALWFMDDWGSQNSLLISPELWRKIFKPLYREYVNIAHQHGKYIFMHSDGYIADIFPDIVELGVDAINSQIFCMNIEDLGKKYRGKITFWGEIDRQYMLSNGNPEEVVEAVRKVKEFLFQRGGVIGQCEFGAGAKPENVYMVFKTWNTF